MARNVPKIAGAMACSIAVVVLLANRMPNEERDQEYTMNSYFKGPRELTIKTTEGTVLSVVQVPAGVEGSLHVLTGSDDGALGVRGGDVVIRVLPANRLKDGPLFPQMMEAPVALSAQNVDVIVK